MKTQPSLVEVTCPGTMPGRSRITCARRILPLLLLLILPVVAQAQFEYTISNGTLTITGYTGAGGDVVIPGTINGLPVTSIGDWAFRDLTGLTSITIPDSVTSIRDYAFYGCTGLTSVTIPDSVTSIRDYAFYGCTGLNAITIDALNPVYSSLDGVLFNKSQTVLIQCPMGKSSVTIPDSVTSIGEWAFVSCAGLTSVTIPGSVRSIAEMAFWGCSRLRAVYFCGDAPAIGRDVFFWAIPTLFYLPGTSGWKATMAERPTVLWNGLFGVQTIQVYGGLTIIGEIGKVYSIDYVTDLTEPAESDWRCLEFLQLPASPYLWADKSAPASGKRFYRAVAMEAPTNMVFIPPGTFRMGSPEDEVGGWGWEGPQTDVTISRGYWMGKYEVTQGEYEAVMGNNPSWFNGVQTNWPGGDFGTDLTRPVETVSWEDAVAYCAVLTERERGAGRIPRNSVYRLPTEAEWEYACRGWTSTRFSYGDDPRYTNLTKYAWYGENSGGQTHPVGQKLPNSWGLYDMHGNVFEWCKDCYGEYLGGIVIDPQGPAPRPFRVIRGGGWHDWYGWGDPRYCRSASRSGHDPDYRDSGFGFRAVLAPGQP